MVIKKQFIPKERTKQRPGIKLYPEYITIHSTANPKSTAQNEADFVCYNSKRKASFHFVCDEKEVIQVLPENEVAFHAGDGKNGTGNRKSLAIEICESGDREKALLNAISLTRSLMVKHSIPLENVVQHNHWSEKDCPRILRNSAYIKGGMTWKWFTYKLEQGENTMDKAEVKNIVIQCLNEIDPLYHSIDEVPDALKAETKKLIEGGYLKGDGSGLNVRYSALRSMIVALRIAHG